MTTRTVTLEVTSDAQEKLLLQYHAMIQELEQLADVAPDGQVFDLCEGAVMDQGRDAQRRLLEQLAQRRMTAAEKKGACSAAVLAATAGKIAGRRRGKSSVASA